MAITNGYCTVDDLRSLTRISDTVDLVLHELVISAASRMIDRHCGRRFWQDGSVVAREYHPDDTSTVPTDDISTATGLLVKTDTADDGTFATSLTITTDFLTYPLNAADEVPVRPLTEIRIASGSTYYFPTGARRPSVQITAKFGWPAIPDEVKLATVFQSQMLLAAKDAKGGIMQGVAGDFPTRVSRFLHPQAELLLADFVRQPR